MHVNEDFDHRSSPSQSKSETNVKMFGLFNDVNGAGIKCLKSNLDCDKVQLNLTARARLSDLSRDVGVEKKSDKLIRLIITQLT